MRGNKGGSSQSMDPYERLGNAIIIQAAKDYRMALRRLSRNKCNRDAQEQVDDIERFFHSDLFGVLTDLDPDMLIRKLREEQGYEG